MDMSTCIRAHMFTHNRTTRPDMFIPTSMVITAGMIAIAGGIEGIMRTANIGSIADTIETTTDDN
jgi:hypothetical protein